MADQKSIKLEGRVFITFDIVALTGLHIGGTETGIEIGGVDKTVIRNPLTNQPYIPGSSLRGKTRSLLEKYKGLKQNQRIGQGYIHSCDNAEVYPNCPVCQIFGVPGERTFATPARLIVRDATLTPQSIKSLEESVHTDLPYSEVKTEVSIDRVTSAANPRQMERVPAGAVFGPTELVYSVYSGDDCDPVRDLANLKVLVEGLKLMEDDYLGGLGSRGSGKVKLSGIHVSVRTNGDYLAEPAKVGPGEAPYADLQALIVDLETLTGRIRTALKL